MLAVILVVDDNEDDVLLIRRAFERAGLKHPIQSVRSGIDCIAYLNGDAPYNNRERFPLPTMVLLDIKMPGTDGFEVLKWIRQQSAFGRLCVAMLTSSDEIRDASKAYQLGANSFYVKPLDFWNATDLSRSIERLLARCSGAPHLIPH
jgi:CheY-like chemotaxis protein